MNHVIVVEQSKDAKLTNRKGVSATYVPQQSCPEDCPLMKNGCYAEVNHMGIHTHRLNKRASLLKWAKDKLRVRLAREEAQGIAALSGERKLRVHVVGDCATARTANLIGNAMVAHERKHGKAAWTYTHSWRRVAERSWRGARVLASCHSAKEVHEAAKQGYAAALTVPYHPTNKVYQYQGLNIVPCPAQFKNSQGNRVVTCETCTLCQSSAMLKARNLTVGFQPDNKTGAKRVLALIQTEA